MAKHKALIGIGQDSRHPDRVRPLSGNDERRIGQEKMPSKPRFKPWTSCTDDGHSRQHDHCFFFFLSFFLLSFLSLSLFSVFFLSPFISFSFTFFCFLSLFLFLSIFFLFSFYFLSIFFLFSFSFLSLF